MTDRLFSLQQLDPEPKASPRPAAERATIGEEGIYEVRTKGDPEPFRRALEMGRCVVTMQGANLEVRVPKGEDGRHILRVAVENGMQVRHLAPLVKTLERAFMQTLRDAGKA